MRKVLSISLLLLIMVSPAHAGEWFSWDETNTKLHVPLTLLMIADLGQTLWIADNCQPYAVYDEYDKWDCHYKVYKGNKRNAHETNGLLGECPTRTEAKQHFAWFYVALTSIVWISPPDLSYTIQGSAITVELYYVGHNLGLSVGFGF